MNFAQLMKRYRYMNEASEQGGAGGSGGDTAVDDKGSTTDDSKGTGGDTTAAGTGKTVMDSAGDDDVGDGKAKPDAKGGKGSEGGYWPDDWRARASNGDAKIATRLARYDSPEAVTKALIAAQNRISSGELKSVLSKDAKPEEITAWRAENGIPETPDKYDLTLGDGLVVGKDDLPRVTKFLEAAHGTNQTPDQVKASLRAYYALHEADTQARHDTDKREQEDATDALRAEWGPEYRRNLNLINGLMDTVGSADMKQQFLNGRLASGVAVGNSPEALKMLLALALVNNPTGTVVPAGGGNQADTVDDEITKIEKVMRTNRADYNKDEKMQARYRDLLTFREHNKKK